LWFTFSFFNKLINIADQTLENTDVQNRLLGQILLIGLMGFFEILSERQGVTLGRVEEKSIFFIAFVLCG
jgi:hypothetical protein